MHYYHKRKYNRFVKKRVHLIFVLDFVLILVILAFTSKQIQRLYVRFQELERRNPPVGFLTREDLLKIPEVTLNPLGQRLVDVIIQDYGAKNFVF